MKSLVINMVSGPGAGKSTLAAGLFYRLKMKQVNCEMIIEFAKPLTWKKHFNVLTNQLYVFAKQYHSTEPLLDQVDVVVTDTSLLLGLMYQSENYFKSLEPLIMEVFHSMNNLVFFINRVKPYNTSGRAQSEEEAKEIDTKVKNMLLNYNIPYFEVDGNESGLDTIENLVITKYMNYKLVDNVNVY